MAIIPFTTDIINGQQGMAVATWSNLAGLDTGQPFPYSNLADKTVQIFGTIGAAITIEGSNDPRVISDPDNAVWEVLHSNFSDALSFTTAGMALIAEAPRWIRPNCAVGISNATVIILSNAS